MARVNPSGLEHDFPCGGLLAALTFAAALGMLTISLFWPYMIQFAITTEQLAAPHSSSHLYLLVCGRFRAPVHAALHCDQLHGVSRPVAPLDSRIQRMRDNFRAAGRQSPIHTNV